MSPSVCRFFLVFCLLQVSILSATVRPIVLSDSLVDYFVSKNYAEHLEDKTRAMSIEEVLASDHLFVTNTNHNLYNQPVSSAHWLRFTIISEASATENVKIELFDFDLEDVSFYVFHRQQLIETQKTGFRHPFHTRSVPHKNIGLDLNIERGDTLVVYMRFFSGKINVLEPVIRLHNRMLDYSLAEYLLLGIFYGLMLLILVFNFIYFLILKNRYYLYYILFIGFILLYLICKNGTGFQYLWPEHPELNPYLDKICLSLGISSMLLFSFSYLELSERNEHLKRIFYAAILVQPILLAMQLVWPFEVLNKVAAVLFIQLSFVAGMVQYTSGFTNIKWYVTAFIFLNISFVINLLEFLGWIPSSAFTVYALNGGIVLQFIFLSVALAESIRTSYQQKNEALSGLVEALHRQESMRLVELKRQMNPHFIFNVLNSVLLRIRSDKKEDAAQFLVQFSKLIRKTLDTSDKIFISLEEELASLKLYIDVESMRLGNTFEYSITKTADIDAAQIKFPTFILQPFVENAIWHGLIPKDGERKLSIRLSVEQKILTILISDNGIGRRKSMEYKKQSEHQSKGVQLIQERLKLIQLKYGIYTSLRFEDLYKGDNIPMGTNVRIEIGI